MSSETGLLLDHPPAGTPRRRRLSQAIPAAPVFQQISNGLLPTTDNFPRRHPTDNMFVQRETPPAPRTVACAFETR